MKRTKIEWTDATWNPLRGCSPTSEGCDHCYAARMAARFSKRGEPYAGLTTDGVWNGRVELVAEHLNDPLHWSKPRRIFVNSMSDLFHEHIPSEWIDSIFAVMALAGRHTFQVLTKRATRMFDYLSHPDRFSLVKSAVWKIVPSKKRSDLAAIGWPLPNVWLGVSVESHYDANERIPLLLQSPAALRFLSCEPLFSNLPLLHSSLRPFDSPDHRLIDWVIVGGESGPNARPMHPDDVRTVRDQCLQAGVPLFFKGWGEWLPIDADPTESVCCHCGCTANNPCVGGCTWIAGCGVFDRCSNCVGKPSRLRRFPDGTALLRVGKHITGRLLDGVEWKQFP